MIIKKPKILLVEDNSNDIELVSIALSQLIIPNDLIIVQDGQEAIDYLLNPDSIGLPDLVLLDLYLPKVNGLEVLKKLRDDDRTKLLPIIIFTATQDQMDLMKGYDLGANACIKKGLEPDEFKAALKNLDVYWLIRSA